MCLHSSAMVLPFLAVNLFKGGLHAVQASGLSTLFGSELGSRLYPYKGLSLHLATLLTGWSVSFLLTFCSFPTLYLLFCVPALAGLLLSHSLDYSSTT